jgi:CHAT domain-containing protein/Tfp pilus assembly protein PilF
MAAVTRFGQDGRGGRQAGPPGALRALAVAALLVVAPSSLAAAQAAAAPQTLGQAQADLETARSLSGRGRHAEAAALLRGTLERATPAIDADAELEARLLLDLANSEVRLAEFAAVEERLGRVEPLLGRVAEPATAARLRVSLLDQRGKLAYFRRDPYAALERRREAVALASALGDPALLTKMEAEVGMTLLDLHDYAGAVGVLERVLATAADPGTEMVALFGLGVGQLELDRLDAAEESLTRLAELARGRGDRRSEALAAGELGLVLRKRGDLDGALAAFDQAIAVCRESGDRFNEAIWWSNKGMVRRDQGRFAEALPFYLRALELQERTPGRRASPNLYKHIGQCRAGLGDDRGALELFDRALAGARPFGDTKVVWETERERARLFRRRGDLAAADRSYHAALDAIESMRGALRLESFKADFFESKVGVFEEYMAFLLEHDRERGAERAFAVSERARARAFLDTLVDTRAQLHETLPEALRREEAELHARISEIQARLRRGAAAARADDETALAAAERALEALHLRVRDARPRFEELQGLAPAALDEVQRRLGEGEALVSFFLAEPASHAWVVRRRSLAHHALAGRARIEEAVRAAYAALLDPHSPPQLEEIAELVLRPLGDAFADADGLLIVPSGALFYFPFEALPLPGGRGLLVERFVTSYWPSAAAVAELRARPTVPAAPRLLALGDPRYGEVAAAAERGSGLRGLQSLGALPHTRREVRALRRLFPGAATVLTGEEARESALKALDTGDYSLLHLAAHGFLDPVSPARSGLVLAPERAAPGGSAEDGILQPREVLRLRLAAALVTLSACQSALGELVSGEGIVGLARAFFYAGTDTVVASLWNVNDRASAELMARFYRHLADGEPKAQALRRARLDLYGRRDTRHPYYWAPWILIGDGVAVIEFPPRRGRLLLPAAAAALLVAAAWVFYRRRHRRRALAAE